MPVGGGKGPAGGYRAGKKGSYGCKGYPTVSADGTVHGCHSTKTAAARQARAIWASVNSQKSDDLPPLTDFIKMKSVAENVDGCSGFAVVDEEGDLEGCFQTREEAQAYADRENAMDMEDDEEDDDMSMKAAKPNYSEMIQPRRGGSTPSNADLYNRIIAEAKRRFDVYPSAVANAWVVQEYKRRGGTYKLDADGEMSKAQVNEGDFVVTSYNEDETVVGQIVHVMREGMLGVPGDDMAIEATMDNPAVLIRIFEQDETGYWEPTEMFVGAVSAKVTRIEPLMTEQEIYAALNNMNKAEGYAPTSGMKSAARRALRWKEEGKATGAGTPVGWGRATDIVAGRSMSLSVVRRMYSFFSRHEVDKKGKDFYNTSNPSNGRIMWDAWGGDAGFSWSRGIVERNKDKALFADFGKDWTKAERLTDVFKRERSMATRERLAASGAAMPDGSYPIVTVEDLRNAIQAFGRASNPQATKEHIMRRARALGRTDLIPENWK